MVQAGSGRRFRMRGRVAGWVRSLVAGREPRPPADLVVIHGFHWIAVESSPLRQPVCPACSSAQGVATVLQCLETDVPDPASIGDVLTFQCPGCGWSGEITREQEREGRGGAARHAIARSMRVRWR